MMLLICFPILELYFIDFVDVYTTRAKEFMIYDSFKFEMIGPTDLDHYHILSLTLPNI